MPLGGEAEGGDRSAGPDTASDARAAAVVPAGRKGRKRPRDIAVDWFGAERAAFERPPPRPGPNSGAGSAPAPPAHRPLERRGQSIRDEAPSLDLERDDGFEPLLAAAVHFRIATGLHAGRKTQ